MSYLIRVKFLFILLLLCGSAEASALKKKIDHLLKSHHLSHTPVSIQVVRLTDGAVLYERDPDRLLNPASTAKLVTAGAALRVLGPDYTFKTEFFSRQPIRNGVVDHLWIKGYGDPAFITEELADLSHRFELEGLKRIEGEIYLDDTYFDREPSITYLSDPNEKVYQIATGPLSFNFNSVEIRARPGERLGDQPIVELVPPTGYVKIINQAKTGRRSRTWLDAELQEREGHELTVTGSIPRSVREYNFRRGILDPTTYAGTVFLEALQAKGISTGGGVRRQAVSPEIPVVLTHSSPPLKKILEGVGKQSNNFIAEQIFKTVGAVKYGPPGSQAKGRQAVEEYLALLGIPRQGFYLENGSGLSKLSRISAAGLMQVLRDLYAAPWRDEFISSLSVGGVDGTLKRRFHGPLRGKVFAKTGTLNQVCTLAGYLMGEGDPVAFVLLFNDMTVSHRRVNRVEEKIIQAIAEETNVTPVKI